MTATKALTIEELIEAALALDAIKAIKARRDDFAALMWIDEIVGADGETIKLQPYCNKNNKNGWAYIYCRVSTPKQKEKEKSGEGWSMRTQFERAIRYCIAHCIKFCVFSDATLSGGMPSNDSTLIELLWKSKAKVYRSVMTAIFLPDYLPMEPQDRAAVEEYINGKCRDILAGRVNDGDEALPVTADRTLFAQVASINARGQEVNKRIYRPGLSYLLMHLDHASLLLVTDSSRLARSVYLMQHILQSISNANVETRGLIESWDWPNQDNLGGILTGNVLAVLYEDTIKSATAGALRGIKTRLENGEPNGLLPFWYVKTLRGDKCVYCGNVNWDRLKSGHHFCSVRVEHAQTMANLYLDSDRGDRGYQAVASELERRHIPPKKSNIWHWTSVRKVLTNPALIGKEREFGLLWDTLDRIVSDDDWARLGHKIRQRGKEAKSKFPQPLTRHLLTGLPTCVCGKGMSYGEGGNYTCNLMHYGRVTSLSSELPLKHTRISAAMLDDLFDAIFREAAEWAIAFMQGDDRTALRLDTAKLALKEITASLPLLERDAFPLAEAELCQLAVFRDKKDSHSYKKALEATVQLKLEEPLQRRAQLQSEVDTLNQLVRYSGSEQTKLTAQERISRWQSSSVQDKNAFLRMYFSELRFENVRTPQHAQIGAKGNNGGEYIIPVLRDGVTRWPAIPIQISGTKALRRKLPDVDEYIRSTYADLLEMEAA